MLRRPSLTGLSACVLVFLSGCSVVSADTETSFSIEANTSSPRSTGSTTPPFDGTEPLQPSGLGVFATADIDLVQGFIAYADRPPVSINEAEVDQAGLRIYNLRSTGERHDHPVVYAQYGLTTLLEYERTGDPMWLERTIVNAERLIEMSVDRDGAAWFPYGFNWTYLERTLPAPWWSGMAQGQALSLFSRLAAINEEDPRWARAAEGTFESFLQPYSETQPWSSIVIDDHLWFEEYAGEQPPLMVLNGHIFAMFGLYDYFELTRDDRAVVLFRGGAATVLEIMPRIRVPGGVSYYCVQPDYCNQEIWQNVGYHPIHSWQLESLGSMTGEPRFSEWADILRADLLVEDPKLLRDPKP